MINVCSHFHDEIAYIGDNCPCCELKDKLLEAHRQLTNMEFDKDKAESQVEDLETQLADLQSSVSNAPQNE